MADTPDTPTPDKRVVQDRRLPGQDAPAPTAPATPENADAKARTDQIRDEVAGKTLLATVWPCTAYTIPGDDGSDDLVITVDGTPVDPAHVDDLKAHAARQDVELVELHP